MALRWRRKRCGCVKTTLRDQQVVIRCARHRGKPAKKRLLLHWEDVDGRLMVRDG